MKLVTGSGVMLAVGLMCGLAACHRQNVATAVPWHIVLTTTPPAPTVPGNTAFKVLVTDSQGQPVLGAKVTVDLIMVTMDMGPNQIVLQPQPGGVYTGSASFTMAGPWNCTVTASAGGHTQVQTFPYNVS
ncbi:MAG TPA: FixH family protein [Terriglobales bacterium]|nr:FixH family protein [Terriglobales bacterium]